MTLTVAQELLIAIVKHKDEKTLAKIKKDWLDSSEIKPLYFIKDYIKEHGELPGLKSFATEFKYDASTVDSRPALYYKKLKDRYIVATLSEEIPTLLRKLKSDPTNILTTIKQVVTDIDVDYTHTKDSYYSEDTKERLEEYYLRVKTKGVTYLSMGHELLDKLFYGYKPTDLITIGGRAGSRKSWLLCFLALICEATLPEDYGDILFISNEMASEELKERLDCIKFQLPYTDFLSGSLSRANLGKYKKGLEELADKKSRICFIYNCSTIEELSAKIAIYKPSIIFLDGSYLMEPHLREGWEKITAITRGLKRIAKGSRVPIINTTQLKRGAGKSEKSSSFDAQDDFAYANSFVQDSDLALRMFQSKDMVFNQEIGIQIAKGRRVSSEIDLAFLCNLTLMILDFKEEEIEKEELIEY